MASGFYTCVIATLGTAPLVIPEFETNLFSPITITIMLGGFLGGVFVSPAVLIADKFIIIRGLAAGCLATLGSALITAFALTFMVDFGSPTPLGLSWDTPEALIPLISIWFSKFLGISFLASILALFYCIIGAPAVLLFSYFLSKRRKRTAPEIDLETFD